MQLVQSASGLTCWARLENLQRLQTAGDWRVSVPASLPTQPSLCQLSTAGPASRSRDLPARTSLPRSSECRSSSAALSVVLSVSLHGYQPRPLYVIARGSAYSTRDDMASRSPHLLSPSPVAPAVSETKFIESVGSREPVEGGEKEGEAEPLITSDDKEINQEEGEQIFITPPSISLASGGDKRRETGEMAQCDRLLAVWALQQLSLRHNVECCL